MKKKIEEFFYWNIFKRMLARKEILNLTNEQIAGHIDR